MSYSYQRRGSNNTMTNNICQVVDDDDIVESPRIQKMRE